MTALLILLIVAPWSIWRQMHTRPVSVSGLVKLPLIFAAAAAVFGLTAHTHGETALQRGNRTTLRLWIAMIVLKHALGTVAAVTGSIPAEGAAAVLGFFALTMAIQNLAVARRTLWAPRAPIGATA